jgi:hypothetical protein
MNKEREKALNWLLDLYPYLVNFYQKTIFEEKGVINIFQLAIRRFNRKVDI